LLILAIWRAILAVSARGGQIIAAARDIHTDIIVIATRCYRGWKRTIRNLKKKTRVASRNRAA
jgi:hypothetical protein